MFRVWTKKLGRVGKSESHVYVTCSDAEQLGKPFLLKETLFTACNNVLKTGCQPVVRSNSQTDV